MYLDVKFVANLAVIMFPILVFSFMLQSDTDFLLQQKMNLICVSGGSNSLFMLAVGLTGNVVVGGDADTGPMAAAGEDSDYYTPEDPPTTILSPLHADKVSHSL
jgi:hypothetical protein